MIAANEKCHADFGQGGAIAGRLPAASCHGARALNGHHGRAGSAGKGPSGLGPIRTGFPVLEAAIVIGDARIGDAVGEVAVKREVEGCVRPQADYAFGESVAIGIPHTADRGVDASSASLWVYRIERYWLLRSL